MTTYTIVERERAEAAALRVILREILLTLESADPEIKRRLLETLTKGQVKSLSDIVPPVRDELVREHLRQFLDDLGWGA